MTKKQVQFWTCVDFSELLRYSKYNNFKGFGKKTFSILASTYKREHTSPLMNLE
jgi:hypothetical protein